MRQKNERSCTLVAVLDADVLFPMILRDTLLRAAAAGCFRLHWSDRILEEVTRNLIEDRGINPSTVHALRAAMEEAFPEARAEDWQQFEPKMRNHPKDRHVVAAAIATKAEVIVTSNIRDFADLPSGIVAMLPDQFLCELLRNKPGALFRGLGAQVSAYRRPPMTIVELLERLGTVAPEFAVKAVGLIEGNSA